MNSKSNELLKTLREYDRVVVVMHDNPDPDAIASGWGVKLLVERNLQLETRLVAGGAIVRAENKHMVKLLEPPMELVNELSIDVRTAIVLVDCAADTSNQIATRMNLTPVAVIDHHLGATRVDHLRFADIRPEVAASAAIVASYLKDHSVDVGSKLATAMLYAFRSETCGNETHFSELDRSMLAWLTEFGDPALLAEIENAPLARDYFADLLLALQSTFIYDDAAICFLPRASGAEIVGEVADMLARCEDVERVLCAAVIGDDLLVSVRTSSEGDNASELLQTTLRGLGSGGGHAHRAGGRVPGVTRHHGVEQIQDDLRIRWLAACGVSRQRGSRLLRKSQIVSNLNR